MPGGRWDRQSKRFPREAACGAQENREIGIPDVPQTCLTPGHIGGIFEQLLKSSQDPGGESRMQREEGKTPLSVSISASRGLDTARHRLRW